MAGLTQKQWQYLTLLVNAKAEIEQLNSNTPLAESRLYNINAYLTAAMNRLIADDCEDVGIDTVIEAISEEIQDKILALDPSSEYVKQIPKIKTTDPLCCVFLLEGFEQLNHKQFLNNPKLESTDDLFTEPPANVLKDVSDKAANIVERLNAYINALFIFLDKPTTDAYEIYEPHAKALATSYPVPNLYVFSSVAMLSDQLEQATGLMTYVTEKQRIKYQKKLLQFIYAGLENGTIPKPGYVSPQEAKGALMRALAKKSEKNDSTANSKEPASIAAEVLAWEQKEPDQKRLEHNNARKKADDDLLAAQFTARYKKPEDGGGIIWDATTKAQIAKLTAASKQYFAIQQQYPQGAYAFELVLNSLATKYKNNTSGIHDDYNWSYKQHADFKIISGEWDAVPNPDGSEDLNKLLFSTPSMREVYYRQTLWALMFAEAELAAEYSEACQARVEKMRVAVNAERDYLATHRGLLDNNYRIYPPTDASLQQLLEIGCKLAEEDALTKNNNGARLQEFTSIKFGPDAPRYALNSANNSAGQQENVVKIINTLDAETLRQKDSPAVVVNPDAGIDQLVEIGIQLATQATTNDAERLAVNTKWTELQQISAQKFGPDALLKAFNNKYTEAEATNLKAKNTARYMAIKAACCYLVIAVVVAVAVAVTAATAGALAGPALYAGVIAVSACVSGVPLGYKGTQLLRARSLYKKANAPTLKLAATCKDFCVESNGKARTELPATLDAVGKKHRV